MREDIAAGGCAVAAELAMRGLSENAGGEGVEGAGEARW
jgi:hypothetical protein